VRRTRRVLATGLVVRRSRANELRDIVPDTAIMSRTFNNRAIDVKGKRYFYKVFLPHDYTPAPEVARDLRAAPRTNARRGERHAGARGSPTS
jgi:hypothetical protein